MKSNEINSNSHRQANVTKTTLTYKETRINCPRAFQFYVDFGASEYGLWGVLGLNHTEYFIGYLPSVSMTDSDIIEGVPCTAS